LLLKVMVQPPLAVSQSLSAQVALRSAQFKMLLMSRVGAGVGAVVGTLVSPTLVGAAVGGAVGLQLAANVESMTHSEPS
jgi:hypothetical protein